MKHARERVNLTLPGVIATIVLGVLLIIYGVIAYYFTSHFGFNTSIDSLNCAFKTVDEVEVLIARHVDSYEMAIEGREGLSKTVAAKDVGLEYVPDGQVAALLAAQNPLAWAERLFRPPGEQTTHASVKLDDQAFKALMKKLDLFNEKKMKPPVDAQPLFEGSAYRVAPEELGTTLDEERTTKLINEAIRTLVPVLDLDETGCYVAPKVFSNNPDLIEAVKTYNTYVPFSITYTFGDETEILDATVAIEWVEFDADGNGAVSEDALIAWVRDFGARHDTVGDERAFKAADGEDVTVGGGTYGWEVDEEAEIDAIKAAIESRVGETREPHYVQRAEKHALPGQPDWGNTYVELDLTDQHMYYFVDGEIEFETDVVTGAPWGGRATPAGVFYILEKLSPTILKGERLPNGKREYETPVKYWMRITWGGVGFHDATWQPWFGGNRYTYAGSHGCINMAYSDAQTLYGILELGTPVISHY
ncbi:MAG: L,D-transpeptidase/peptidoglycan binding protein [Coriobacteriales bacterium]|jgi:hypothetical protein|nr:L,D-transpeptidase/peptidoglycan binding protein [Coriobacteriales bacterium]